MNNALPASNRDGTFGPLAHLGARVEDIYQPGRVGTVTDTGTAIDDHGNVWNTAEVCWDDEQPKVIPSYSTDTLRRIV